MLGTPPASLFGLHGRQTSSWALGFLCSGHTGCHNCILRWNPGPCTYKVRSPCWDQNVLSFSLPCLENLITPDSLTHNPPTLGYSAYPLLLRAHGVQSPHLIASSSYTQQNNSLCNACALLPFFPAVKSQVSCWSHLEPG